MGKVTKGKRKATIELQPQTLSYLSFLKSQGEYRSIGGAIDDLVSVVRSGGFIVGDPKGSLISPISDSIGPEWSLKYE